MLRSLIAVLAFVVMSGAADAQSGRRVALVVGVSNYQHVPKLGNPTNDAMDISNAFYRLGFQVQTLIDPDRKALEDAIRKLGRDAEGAEAGIFYYSGHALEVSGQNLLVPASADIRSERDLRFETVDLDSVLDSVSGRGKVSLLILDSCRDNPFSKQLAGSTRAISLRGLGHVDAAVGTLIAFSTAPGKTAADGDFRNSPFTAALLHNIERPGIEVRRMLGDVRREVREATSGKQIPWENSALEGEFFFKPLPPAADKPAPAPPPPQVAESQLQQALRVALQKAMPNIDQKQLEAATRDYVETKENKAQAASRDKNAPWRTDHRENAYSAERAALEGCQMRHGSPCILVAVNEAIVDSSAGGGARSTNRVDYDGVFDPIQIPAAPGAWRWRDDVAKYLSKPAPKAIAIHPWGHVFASAGAADQKTAEAEALKACNEDPIRAGRDGPCFLYAINNHVVLGLRITGPRSPAKTISEAVRLVGPVRADEAYRAALPLKALAVQPETGDWSYWDGAPTADYAESMALGHCQVIANKPCVLIARDDVLMTDNPVEAPRRDMDEVRMRGVFNINKMPFRPRVSFDIIRGYDQLSQPKAMAVKLVPPRYISATGATLHDAEQKALSDCNSIAGGSCLLYAVNDTIVLPDRKTRADP